MAQQSTDVIFQGAEVINKTMHNFKTKIGKVYSTKDVIKTWDCISKWIENNLNQDKVNVLSNILLKYINTTTGILIKGIGYFTISQWDINVGKSYPYTIRRPVFVIDEKLAKDYNLQRNRPYNLGKIRERYLNVISVAQEYKLNIEMVTHCFKEVVTAFRNLLYLEKNCELPFPKIGKLQIKNKIVTMKFYQEFLDRQNLTLKNRIEDEKKKLQSLSYDPDWNADQFKNQKRPCSAMSIISRPASALSQYRPGTGYIGVLSVCDENTDRPLSSLSNCSQNRPTSGMSARPESRTSVRSNDQIRPGSRTSIQSYNYSTRPGSRASSVESYDQARPESRKCTDRARPRSSVSVDSFDLTRPGSRASIKSQHDQTRPESRTSIKSCDRTRPTSSKSINYLAQNRPESRTSIRSLDRTRPVSRTSVKSYDQTTRPDSKTSMKSYDPAEPMSRNSRLSCDRTRPISKLSVRSNRQDRPMSKLSVQSIRPGSSSKPLIRTKSNDMNLLSNGDSQIDRPNSNMSSWKQICEHFDTTLCSPCNIMKNRLDQIDISKPEEHSVDSKDNFMKGENPINRLLSMDNMKKRKNVQKEISKYNYVTAQEIEDVTNNEKNKLRNEKNIGNFILNKRPSSISNHCEKIMDLKHSLRDQIDRNAMKKEKDKITSLNSDKLIQKELLKSLCEERMKSIEAKNQKKKNYSIMLDEHMKNKIKINDNAKNKDKTTPTTNIILCPSESRNDAKLSKDKNRKLAEFQLNQLTARNLVSQKEKEMDIEFEKKLLNQIQEEEKKLRENLLRKKLDQRKFLTEDFNKLLNNEQIEHRKNEIPNSYPMSFPLKKVGDHCRRCKKNRPGLLLEKISDLPC